MKRKSYLVLSMLLAALFALSAVPAQAGFYGSEDVGACYFDFETEEDFLKIDGNVTSGYYAYAEGEGAGGTSGSLKLSPGLIGNYNMVNGFRMDSFFLKEGATYRLSYKAMVKSGEDAVNAEVKPVLFVSSANGTFVKNGTYNTAKETVSYDEVTGVYSFEKTGVWRDLNGAFEQTVEPTGVWANYSYDVTYTDGLFTAGSGSAVAIDSASDFKLILRTTSENANAEVYVDDLAFEQVTSASTEPDTTYIVGPELMNDSERKMKQLYHSEVVSGLAYKAIAADGTVTDGAGGRGYFKTAGKTGDGMYAAVAPKDKSVRFTSHGYNMENVRGNTLYQFSARLKAPAVTVDETLETDGVYYLNSETGAVSVKTDAVTNGYIDAVPYFAMKPKMADGSWMNETKGAFTGYLDADGNYVPFQYDKAAVNNGGPTLTTEWVDYVGYIILPAEDQLAWDNFTYVSVNVTNASGNGVLYVDELSIKEYSGPNLVPNGDFALTTVARYNALLDEEGNEAVNYRDIPLVFTKDHATGTADAGRSVDENGRMYIYQPAGKPYTLSPAVKVEANILYRLRVRVKVDTLNVIGDLNINLTKGEETLQITEVDNPPQVTNAFETYEYTFIVPGTIATNGDVAPKLNITVAANNAAEGSASLFYEKMELVAIPETYTHGYDLAGDLHVDETVTLIWNTHTDGMEAAQLVKISQGNDAEGYALLQVCEATAEEQSIQIPACAYGKKLKFEVVSYSYGYIASYGVYTTDAIVTRKSALDYNKETGAVYAVAPEDEAVLLYATYDSATGRMVDCKPVYITDGVYEASALPEDLELGDKVKITLWKDMSSLKPLVSCATN